MNSNLITQFTGYWLALHFTSTPFLTNWDVFIFTTVGSKVVLVTQLFLTIGMDVDINPIMERTIMAVSNGSYIGTDSIDCRIYFHCKWSITITPAKVTAIVNTFS